MLPFVYSEMGPPPHPRRPTNIVGSTTIVPISYEHGVSEWDKVRIAAQAGNFVGRLLSKEESDISSELLGRESIPFCKFEIVHPWVPRDEYLSPGRDDSWMRDNVLQPLGERAKILRGLVNACDPHFEKYTATKLDMAFRPCLLTGDVDAVLSVYFCMIRGNINTTVFEPPKPCVWNAK